MTMTRSSKTRKAPAATSANAAPSPLADAYRRWGYLQANLDDLGRIAPFEHPDITDAVSVATSKDAEKWRGLYCGPIGVEFMHMIDRERVRWVAQWMESPPSVVDQQQQVLSQLAAAELFERFLHARYVGSKRYSIEGVAGAIPLIESVLDCFTEHGGEYVVIAMSHRGRLNVMSRIVGIAEAELFAGQEDVDPKSVLGSGDVKYHLGATGTHETMSGHTIRVHLVSNPSHLEAVDPVVMGRVRAKQDRMGASARERILSLTLHGDAAFAGQGITAETLNFADLPGYEIGGTVHVVVNNLIGFTAEPRMLHSSRFASDLARRLSIPIIHVNGEDPDAVVRAGRMAIEFRAAFGDDVIVDLIGYRRYGHSEVEDPSTTQPLLYQKIKDRPMLWEMYAERIGAPKQSLEEMRERIWTHLTGEQEKGRELTARPTMRTLPSYWDAYRGDRHDPSETVETAVPAERLTEIAERITTVPEDFTPHPKIKKGLEQRLQMIRGERRVDWGMAEALAFGSLMWDGMPVRFTGEDSRRGTFNQRNAVLIDASTAEEYTPLSHLHPDQGRFDIIDSPLSEAAALGYEYGYSRDYPDALVCWEAQFGDFANGAQTIIDQFISAGEDKWSLLSGLVMMLPHGFEGQGPEHSSARLERFLQLAAEDNIQICQPVTSCQYFHLVRRQALQNWRKPLVLFTPKSLLRADVASSPFESFTKSGCFRPVFEVGQATDAERVLICTGKITHELDAERKRRNATKTAIISLAQLYPFPKQAFLEEMRNHPYARKVVWVQEEPANMGALSYMRGIMRSLLGDRHLTSVKRSESASPATGSTKAHLLEQSALIKLAFA
jgi:2-oxoglutarate dehydrogenase E1 component